MINFIKSIMYQISYHHLGETNTKRVALPHKMLETYDKAKQLLNQEKDNRCQAGFQVSEILNDSFSCIDPHTQRETIFQIKN